MSAPAQVWLSARELAALLLPGLPGTQQGIGVIARREKWISRPRAGRGGGVEYSVLALPGAALDAYLAGLSASGDPAHSSPATQGAPLASNSVDAPVAVPGGVVAQTTPPGDLADWQRDCANARGALLNELAQMADMAGITKAVEALVKGAANGTLNAVLMRAIPQANARGGATGSRVLSARTLYRWRADYVARGWDGLVPEAPPPGDVPVWALPLLTLYRRPGKPSLMAALERLPAVLPQGVALPSYTAAQRLVARMSAIDLNRGRMGPMALLSKQPFKRRDTSHLSPMDVVTSDGHTLKMDVQHPHNPRKVFRPEVCVVQDTATRFVFGWSAGLAESAQVVQDAVLNGLMTLGQFAIFYTDNGSGYVAEAMTAETFGLLSRIGATAKNSTEGRAQARGKIERLQNTLWKRAARFALAYSGRDMDNEARRKITRLVEQDIRATGASRHVLAWPEFMHWAQETIDAYNDRPHRGLPRVRDDATGKLRHLSPREALADARANGWEPQMLPQTVLDDLARPYVVRRTRRGEVTLRWGNYFHPALAHHDGADVRVGFTPHDGSRVWVRTLDDGALICIAERNANVIPEQPASAVEHGRMKRLDARLRLLTQKAEDARIEARGKGMIIEHMPVVDLPLDFEAAHAETIAAFETPRLVQVEVAPVQREEDAWYARACRLEAARNAGQTLDTEDAEWLVFAVTTHWFKAARASEEMMAAFEAEMKRREVA